MKVGERGQVTIPKPIRDQFGLGPQVDVEFKISDGRIVLRKAPRKMDLRKWQKSCARSFSELGYSSVDEFIEDVRGR
jgi:AbrB family looped-hinge helix DNA binding protein